jgi:hypothetical protein
LKRRPFYLILGLLAAALAARADLAAAKAEPNLEKRSKLALDNAFAAMKQAQDAYRSGETVKAQAGIDEVRQSVEMARDSLDQTGKDPRRSPKWFKRAEIQTRDLARRLEAFENEMSYTDRPMVKKTRTVVQEAHDHLLEGLMEGRRK